MIMSNLIYFFVFLYTCIMMYLQTECIDNVTIKYDYREIKKGFLYKTLSFMVVFAPIICVYGFRYDVGVDYLSYYEVYNSMNGKFLSDFLQYFMEPGYMLINYICQFLHLEACWVFLICGLIIFACFYQIIQYYGKKMNAGIAMFIFFAVLFGLSCNIMRQAVALAIVCTGIKYIEDKKIWNYLLTVFLTMMFHKSAIVCILFYWIYRWKGWWKIFCIASIFFMPIVGALVLKLLSQFSWYGGYISQVWGGSGYTYLLYMIPTVLMIEVLNFESQKKYEKLTNLYYFTIPMQALGTFNAVVERMGCYSMAIQVMVVPLMLRQISNTKKRQIYTMIIILWYLIYFIVMNVILAGNDIYPYQWYWNQVS